MEKLLEGAGAATQGALEALPIESIPSPLPPAEPEPKGYGTDVIKDEFGDIENSKLVEFSINPNNNVIITPHVGGMTIEAQKKSYNWTIEKFSNE